MKEEALAFYEGHVAAGYPVGPEGVKELCEEIRRLNEELGRHHCESCDGSAPECRVDYDVRDGKRVKYNPSTESWDESEPCSE